jgi:hypothetical protein
VTDLFKLLSEDNALVSFLGGCVHVARPRLRRAIWAHLEVGRITKVDSHRRAVVGRPEAGCTARIRNVVSPETAAWSVTSRQHIWSVQRGHLRIPKQAMNSFFTRED